MKTLLMIAAVALLGISSCSDLGTPPPVERSLDDIRETVFRYMFLHNASSLQQSAPVYFIGLMGPAKFPGHGTYSDPSEDLMARFSRNVPPVKKFSECTRNTYGVFDTSTGVRALLFRVETIIKINDDEVEVTGGYYEAGLNAGGNIYTVRRIDERWIVVKDEEDWYS